MNTTKVQNALDKTNALIQQLESIIIEVRKQEQAIVNHRVSLGAQLAELKTQAAMYENMLNDKED